MRTQRLRESVARANGSQKSALDSTLVVAAFTALSYAVAYQYESGYCSHFRIPTQLISPTPSVLVAALLGLVVAAVTAAPLIGLFRAWATKRGLTDLARWRLEMALFFSFIALASAGLTWVGAVGVLISFLVTCGVYLTAFAEKGSLHDRLLAVERTPDPADDHNPVLAALRGADDRRLWKFFLLAWLSLFAARGAGAFDARNQSEFQVISARPDVALVRSYGDVLVGIKFSERTNAATGEIVVFKLGDEFKELHVSRKRIGPLSRPQD